ncbi:MAG: molybdopterin-guanine dinucleotide biosynthesis protein B [Syntrophomonadaceae bacterium]|jgi:molybdopterin-guanine dinucleotide biosynthesis protein B|nr:molybdopterin-guanine dinucleotide biosynthesis protein B [Syntrophomonadaceae bacterium]
MVPVVSFIGRHNSGKTTILEKVVSYFCAQGYRIGVIKHSSHDFTIDVPDTDSYRLAKAGARAVVVSSPQKMAFYKQVQRDYPLDELCRLMQEDVDIIFAEGFKREHQPKIEVARQYISGELIRPSNLVAMVTDFPVSQSDVPVFGFDEVESLCRYIQDMFIDSKY